MHDVHRLLRQATATHHARLDAVLGGGFARCEDYAAYVRGMRDFVADADHALGGAPVTTRLRERLGEDCVTLGLDAFVQPDPMVMRQDDGAARIGWEYVVAGASLGARFLLRDARKLGFDAGRGASFLAAHAVGDDWTTFLGRLADDDVAPDVMPRVCGGAIDAFAAAERRMRAARGEIA